MKIKYFMTIVKILKLGQLDKLVYSPEIMLRNIQRSSQPSSILNPLSKSMNKQLNEKTKRTIRSISLNSRPSIRLSTRPFYTYFTLIDKPLPSVSLTSVIQLASQPLTYPYMQWSCPAEASILIGGIAFRVIAQVASKFFQEMKFQKHENRWMYRIVKNVFLVDLERDAKFYEFNQRKKYLMMKYYKLSYLVKNLFTAYLGLNFFRACHFILEYSQFNSFNIHTLWVPTLASHDPTFVLPIITMGFTYLWLTKSRHPFLIHLTKPQNLLYRINIAFMAGLVFVPLPSIYAFGYVGWMAGHLLIRTLQHEGSDLREEWRKFFGLNKQFIEKRQLKAIENLKKDKDQKSEQSLEEKDKK